MWKITISGLVAHKARLFRTCSAVLIGVAFLAGTLVLGDTMRAGFSQVFSDIYANTDLTVRGADIVGSDSTEQRRLVPADTVEAISALPEVDRAVASIEGFAQVTGADGEAVGGSGPPTAGAAWIDDPALNPYTVVEGRAPAESGEIAIDRGTAKTGALSIGDTTIVRTPTPVSATVVGILAFGEQDSIGGSSFTAFAADQARALLIGGQSGATSVEIVATESTTPEQLQAAVQQLLPDRFEALTAAEATAAAEQSIGEDFLDMFQMFLLVFTGVALLVAGFSIYNTFSVILAQRTRESALLRAVGATRRQVLGSITAESVIIGLLASIGGVLAGIGLAAGLSALMRASGVDLPGSIRISTSSVVVSVFVGLTLTIAASLAPAVRACGVAPLAALRDAAVDGSATSRPRLISGTVITVAGIALVLYAALWSPAAALSIVGVGAVATVIGTVVLGPALAGPAARVIGAPLTFRRGATGELARGNATRNPARTAGTASALMIGVAVVALFTVLAGSISASVRDSVVGTIKADLLVIDEGFSGAGMSPDLTLSIAELPEVDDAVGLGFGAALFDGEEQEFTVTDPAPFAAAMDNDVIGGSVAGLAVDQVAVSQGIADDRGWSLGSPIAVEFIDGTIEELTVGAVYRQAQLAGDVVMPRVTWSAHSIRDLDFVAAITLADGVGLDAGADAVGEITSEFGAPAPRTLDEYADDVAGQINQMLMIVYVLLALSILIALMGIANTLALSIHERTRELGLLRAIGQTRAQVRSMVRSESVIIAVYGTIAGIVLGVFLSWGLLSAIGGDSNGLTRFAPPWSQLAIITVVGAIAGVIAALRPARRASLIDVLDAIATE